MNYKNLGIRFVAIFIDGFILGFVGNILSIAVGGPKALGMVTLRGSAGLLFLIISLAYYILMEAYCNGQTLGKMATKIKVVQESGQPCDLGTAVVRNILRIVDFLPFCYLIGAILIGSSPKKQRLGDRIAHTVVIDAFNKHKRSKISK